MKKHPTADVNDLGRTLRKTVTAAEAVLWRELRLRQINGKKFRRQVPIGSYIADFACHEARLVIGVDGGQHDLADARELARTARLEADGYRVLRFWNNEVLENIDGVCAVIALALREASPPSQPSPVEGEGFDRAP